jgi:O-acetyl-ADP-ribose deacetylase (regulator of RNase III)
MVPIEVVRGSLLEQDVEAIVNAANPGMRGGGGIDGAIHRAAGRELLEELMRVAPHAARAGQVVVTPGFRTGFRYIFHTAGPIWRGGLHGEPVQLADCYRNAVLEAEKLGVRTLGFCSISTGIFSFPLDRAAPIALKTVRETATQLDRIVFAMFGEKEYEVFAAELERGLGG